MKKIIFLDIDGTLVDFDSKMPELSKKALMLAKENGCYIALCTGRTVSSIYPWLLEFPFDGIVASAGAYVSCGNELVFQHIMEREKLKKLALLLDSYHASYMFQGAKGAYMNEVNKSRLQNYMISLGFHEPEEKIKITISDHPYDMEQIESGVYFGAKEDVFTIQKMVDPYFKITSASFGPDRKYTGEITCAGVNKATGMQILMEHLGLPKESSIAFGDGPNDVEMLQYAGIGVAMGNAEEDLKLLADMITDSITENGIYNGFLKLGII